MQDVAPYDLEVLLPIDLRLSPVRQIAPDITVVRRQERAATRVTDVPLLVVEVQSPSTRAVDLALKRQVLQEAGVPSYWLVEPDEPALTVLELVDGVYEQVALVRGAELFEAKQPFRVQVVPEQLSR